MIENVSGIYNAPSVYNQGGGVPVPGIVVSKDVELYKYCGGTCNLNSPNLTVARNQRTIYEFFVDESQIPYASYSSLGPNIIRPYSPYSVRDVWFYRPALGNPDENRFGVGVSNFHSSTPSISPIYEISNLLSFFIVDVINDAKVNGVSVPTKQDTSDPATFYRMCQTTYDFFSSATIFEPGTPETIKSQLVPAKNNESNEYGIYDLKTGSFYPFVNQNDVTMYSKILG